MSGKRRRHQRLDPDLPARAWASESGSIGLGFAIPIDEVLPVIDQMKNGETPTHARLGDHRQRRGCQPDSAGAEVTEGAQIQEITDGSAAGSAGLESGDVITKIDDNHITGSDSLVATVRSYRPGDEVKVTYEHDGEEKTTSLTLDSDAENDATAKAASGTPRAARPARTPAAR